MNKMKILHHKKIIDIIIIILLIIACCSYIAINYMEAAPFAYKSEMEAANVEYRSFKTGDIIEQYFICDKKTFCGIEIVPARLPAAGNMYVTIETEGNCIVEETMDMSAIDKSIVVTTNSPIECAEEQVFRMAVKMDIPDNDSIEIAIRKSFEEDSSFFINGSIQGGMNVNFAFIYKVYNINWLVILLAFISAALIFISYYMGEMEWKIEHSFLVLIILLGILYYVSFPIFRAPDEINHYMRAFEISQGNMVSQHVGGSGVGGNLLPKGIIPGELQDARKINFYKVIDHFSDRLSDKKTELYTYGNTALYAPFVYLPQTIGILAARLMTRQTILIAYAGRMCTFVFCVFLLYISIKNVRYGKMIYFIISFMPMMLSQIVSLSADAVTNTIIFTFVSYIIKYCYGDHTQKIGNRQLAILFALMVELSFCKIVYLPICLLIFLLPDKLFKERKNAFVYKVLSIGIVVVANLIWLSISAGFLIEFNPGVDSEEQVLFVLTHIPQYFLISFRTFLLHCDEWLQQMVGSNLGWAMDVEIPKILILVYLGMIFGSLVINFETTEKYAIKSDKTIKLLTGFAFFGVIALIFTSLYVQWTPVANNVINGIQGRYFIPVLPLLVMILNNRCYIVSRKCQYKYLYMTISCINIFTIIKQVFFYI